MGTLVIYSMADGQDRCTADSSCKAVGNAQGTQVQAGQTGVDYFRACISEPDPQAEVQVTSHGATDV